MKNRVFGLASGKQVSPRIHDGRLHGRRSDIDA
jgi:hypothetical protein